MFISTVVHFIEIILLSLLGIMFYKLFATYKRWKSLSVSSSSKGGDRSPKLIKPTLPQNPDYLSISKITVTEEQPSTERIIEKKSSVILTDYIGEFFAESKPMDLSPYRMEHSLSESVTVAPSEVSSSLCQQVASQTALADKDEKQGVTFEKAGSLEHDQAEDEFIQVKPLNLRPVILANSKPASNHASDDLHESIPTLNDLVDTDSEGYITVASGHTQAKANNIMSDKVVLAMLDEAKLVCAS